MSSEENANKTLHAIISARHNIRLVKQWTDGMDHVSFTADTMKCYAVLYAFVIIAGAVKDIPKTVLERYGPPRLWKDIHNFRNYLAHVYDDLPDRRIMDTINFDLPNLSQILEKMLGDLEMKKS